MKFEIDNEMVDKIIVEKLKEDYISQQNDITRLLNKGEHWSFEVEDLWNFKEVSDALEVLLRYYMYRGDADKFISENSA